MTFLISLICDSLIEYNKICEALEKYVKHLMTQSFQTTYSTFLNYTWLKICSSTAKAAMAFNWVGKVGRFSVFTAANL